MPDNYYISAIGCYDNSISENMPLSRAKAEMKAKFDKCMEDISGLDSSDDGIDIEELSIEIGVEEYYQSWVIREAIDGEDIISTLRKIIYMTEDCGREETRYQWTLEDANAGSVAAEIGIIVKDIIERMEKNAEEVKHPASGETFMMTPDQIYAAYRHQEYAFRNQDARNHLAVFIYGDDYEYVDPAEKEEAEKAFQDTYHTTVKDAFDILEDFTAEFNEIFDANIAENTLWETAIENVLRNTWTLA